MSVSSPAYSLTPFAPRGRRLHLESRWPSVDCRSGNREETCCCRSVARFRESERRPR